MPFDPAVVAAHAEALDSRGWFDAAERPFSAGEELALAELAPRIERVAHWGEARRIADDARGNAAYDADAHEAALLKARAQAAAGRDAVLEALTAIVDRGADVFFAAAERALARAGLHDDELSRVAAGAAAEAVYRAALADAVDGREHRFVRVGACFAAGRWPLARIGTTLYVL
jgi:hypothetical protein